MDLSEETYERAVRLGRLVPKVVEIKRFVDVPNVIVAPIPVARPVAVFSKYPPAQDIMDIASEFYGVPVVDIRSNRRLRHIIRPRHVCMYLMRALTTMSLPSIGNFLGGKDHSGTMKAIKTITDGIATDQRLADEIDLLKIRIGEVMAAKNTGLQSA